MDHDSTCQRSHQRLHRVRTLHLEPLEPRQMLSGGTALDWLGTSLLPGLQRVASVIGNLVSGKAKGDAYETDNTPQQAQTITTGGATQTHSIHVSTDVDWVKFTLDQPRDVLIETRGAAGGDTEMWLYAAADTASPLEYDNDDGIGNFARILRAGPAALQAGTYFVKVDAGPHSRTISQYTISVTGLQTGDILLVRATDLLGTSIRVGEAIELKVPYSATYSHAAIYLGNDQVAEMEAEGCVISALGRNFENSTLVDIYRHRQIGEFGDAVASLARTYEGTGYAYGQLAVFALAAVNRNRLSRVLASPVYSFYLKQDYGDQRMICSELVARVFAETDSSLTIQVTSWPTLKPVCAQSVDYLMDFTSPTMLARSASLRQLNA